MAPRGDKAPPDEPKRVIDWERIEAEYRAGQLSTREIARTNGVNEAAIRKRAKAHGWERKLADKVRESVKEKLVRADGTQGGTQAQRARDADIVEAASLRGFEIVTSHRKDLLQLHALKRIILDRLAAHLNGETPEGPFMGEKETPGDLVEKLSRVTSRLIPLERQAHNLDETPPGASVTVAQTVANMTAERYETIARKVSDEF